MSAKIGIHFFIGFCWNRPGVKEKINKSIRASKQPNAAFSLLIFSSNVVENTIKQYVNAYRNDVHRVSDM